MTPHRPAVFIGPAILACWLTFAVAHAAKAQAPCPGHLPPVVFVHGFLGSGDNWAEHARRLEASGWCPDRLQAFDWNSLDRGARPDSLLDVFIRRVLRRTGAQQVVLVAHSAGGGVCARLLSVPDRAALVSHYVHIGSSPLPAPPGGIPTLNIYSRGDRIASRAADIPGAVNLRLQDPDHLEVATCEAGFRAILDFVSPAGSRPYVGARGSMQRWRVSGKAVVLGENTPLSGARVEAWAYDTLTGRRLSEAPAWSGLADSTGRWDGFEARSGTAYTFVLRPRQGRTVQYFLGPVRHHRRFTYLRALPSTGMAAMLLSGLPSDSATSALAVFTANQAVVQGRDTLACNGTPLSGTELTPPAKTCIALFLYDAGRDGIGTGRPMSMFSAAPFLNGADMLLPAVGDRTIRLHYNGRDRVLPALPSREAVMVAVFD